MERKTAIIIGVIILVLTSIITPFILRKINDKANNISQGTQLEEVNKQENSSNQLEENLSKEVSKEKEQIGSGDENEEQKSAETSEEQEITKQENIGSTIENETTSSQGTTNQTTQSTEEKNNVPTNVVEEVIEENVQNIEIIEVVQNEQVNQEVQTQPEQEIVEEVEQSNIVVPEGAVGILKIDKINLYQKVAEGHSLEVLKTDLGHVDETAYYKGNIGILGQNNGNAGYFKRLTELTIDDEIQYITENGTMRYKVSEITEIEDTDWSKLSKTEDNRITLITFDSNVATQLKTYDPAVQVSYLGTVYRNNNEEFWTSVNSYLASGVGLASQQSTVSKEAIQEGNARGHIYWLWTFNKVDSTYIMTQILNGNVAFTTNYVSFFSDNKYKLTFDKEISLAMNETKELSATSITYVEKTNIENDVEIIVLSDNAVAEGNKITRTSDGTIYIVLKHKTTWEFDSTSTNFYIYSDLIEIK